MESHQGGQEETLVKVRVETDNLEGTHRTRGSPPDRYGCFKCAIVLATVIGLVIVALVVGFILHFFMYTPSYNQDAPPVSDTAKVNVACNLKKSDEQGRYDIFTVNKAATYLIFGWVKLSEVTNEEVILKQIKNQSDITIQKTNVSKTEIFFYAKVKIVNGSRISIYFTSRYTDSLFHVYEL